jgi:hypothetical protein
MPLCNAVGIVPIIKASVHTHHYSHTYVCCCSAPATLVEMQSFVMPITYVWRILINPVVCLRVQIILLSLELSFWVTCAQWLMCSFWLAVSLVNWFVLCTRSRIRAHRCISDTCTLSQLIYETVAFAVFSMIAKGWCITRNAIPGGEWRRTILVLCAFYMGDSIILVLKTSTPYT